MTTSVLEYEDSDYQVPPIQNWDELDLPTDLLRGIYAYGFEKPSPIQQKAIQPMMEGRDVVVRSPSGLGKSGCFIIGALSKIQIHKNNTQVLILSPTRELTTQTAKVVSNIGNFIKGLQVNTFVGGQGQERNNNRQNMFSAKNTPHIICGCPGKVYDMLQRGTISGQHIRLIVLDEADEMLSSGFQQQVYSILQYLPNDVQVCLFSATIPDNLRTIIYKITQNAVSICVKQEQLTLDGICQYYIAVNDDKQKYESLKHLFSFINMSHTIIYCNSIIRVQDLYEAMRDDQFPVCCIHSNMDKVDRDSAFRDFKSGACRVLISSNVTARGIDIQQVSVVINFDVPNCVHTYLHRIGRSGRWGRKGVAINLITSRDAPNMKKIEEHYSTQIHELPDNFMGNIG